MPEIGQELRDTIRSTIEDAGAEYLGIRGDSVSFRDPESDAVCTLYIFAATRVNVRLSLKEAREKVRDFPHSCRRIVFLSS